MKNNTHLRHSNNWEIIWMLAKTDLKMRYQGSWLGIIWVFLKPFCLFLILNFVFLHLFFKDTPTYSIRLLVGLVLWSFFAEASMNGMISLLAKAHILKKIYMPKWLIIVSSSIHSSLAFFFNLIILFIFLFFYYHIYPSFLHILAFLLYVSLIYGISLVFSFFTATLYVKLRDLNQIWELLLQVLFYASPIIYPFTAVPANVRSLLYLNPMTLLIEHSRIALIDNGIARLDHLLIFICIFIPCLLVSIWFMNKTSRKIIEIM